MQCPDKCPNGAMHFDASSEWNQQSVLRETENRITRNIRHHVAKIDCELTPGAI